MPLTVLRETSRCEQELHARGTYESGSTVVFLLCLPAILYNMIAIMTVTGLDHTGIIAAVATQLAKVDANITNVSQTIMGDYFTMILQVDFDENSQSLDALQDAMKSVEVEQKLKIRLQSEAIFRAMHEL